MTTETTTPTKRDCMTCVHMATHDRCQGCLNTPEDFATFRATREMPPMRYTNWEEGNWLAAVTEAQRTGRRDIVIGGQGEAEVNTRDTPQEAARRLRHVAEQCGYRCEQLRGGGDEHRLRFWTFDGLFEIEWIRGELAHIWRLDMDKEGRELAPIETWPG